MQIKSLVNVTLGIATELAYCFGLILSCFFACLIISFIKF